jgi:FkbM family methyltransferase
MPTVEPLNPDDQPFHHYSWKHRAIAWVSQQLCDNLTYTVRRGLLKGMKRRGGLAWLPGDPNGSGITAEEQFWRAQSFTGLTVYDVGAFHGLLTLYFSRQARQVISYEPNARNHARLIENLRLNGVANVIVRKVGVGDGARQATMVTAPDMPGGASIEPETVAGLRASIRSVVSEDIEIVTLDQDIAAGHLPAPDFIKIDIEGEELAALRGARNTLLTCKPRLFLEMHGQTMSQKRRHVAAIVEYLEEADYDSILHVESGTWVTGANCAQAAEGHLYCTALTAA